MEQRPKSVANDVDVQQVDAETVFGEVVEYAFCLLLQRNVLDDYEIASAECHGGQAQAVADGANWSSRFEVFCSHVASMGVSR